ncbi:hypothetical protein Q0590_31715 [Rhodocytophaga aerolata]|uniref:Uncharacterized protein n=1 Tax=Rhodocytophaga aerolata TaxID=455078 RepID=A0ABT8RFM9_9BACT|nr:hypothetical protein [Rhodocytophaga aerolata]MDO1450885.1 hypothetical protein [Rhodocytophaga aerolata]
MPIVFRTDRVPVFLNNRIKAFTMLDGKVSLEGKGKKTVRCIRKFAYAPEKS